jgi:hypothetical protein
VLAIPLLLSPILHLREMSGFELRELPYKAGALPTQPPKPMEYNNSYGRNDKFCRETHGIHTKH